MNNKKARLFLRIGLVIFALSVIGLLNMYHTIILSA